MGIIVAIIGNSGDGKTTSTIINKDGKFDLENYSGMNPESHFIINLDRKALPFPAGMWCTEKKNYIETSDFAKIKATLEWIAKQEHIKSVSLDTINIFLSMKEFNERKKLTFDNWRDIANDVIEINRLCNEILRPDQIAYIFGHTMLQTMPDGSEKMVFSVIGKKLQRTPPEGFYPVLLMTRVEYGFDGDNSYFFQTKANKNSVKTPLGMFAEYELPNSLALIDQHVREYFKI